MIVVDAHRVVRDKMTVAPIGSVAVFGRSSAAHSLHFDASCRADADLNGPILHERPIHRIVVIAVSGDHAQDQVAAAAAFPYHSTRLVAPGKIPAFALKKAGGPGPVPRDAA